MAMNRIGTVILGGLAVIVFALTLAEHFRLHGQDHLFTIISPTDGQSVSAGSSIQLVLSPTAGYSLTDIYVWSPIGSYVQHNAGPVTLTIPNGQLGPVTLQVLATGNDGSQDEVSRTIQIITNQTLNSITISPSIVRLVAPSTTSGYGLTETTLTIVGNYADGISRDVSHFPQATVASGNSSVATVDAGGIVHAVAPGQTFVSVSIGPSSSPIIGSAKIQVNIFEQQGDLNGDGAVDQNDLNIILRALNTSSTGPGDPRDLNNDGRIDALDSRLLVNLCSRPACATK
jgi:Dockerin type I domain